MKCKGEDMCDCNGSCRSNADAMHVQNLEYLGEVPEGYVVAMEGSVIVAANPLQPPLKFNLETREWERIEYDAG